MKPTVCIPKALSAPKNSAASPLSLGFGHPHYRPALVQCNCKLGSDCCEKRCEITVSSLYRDLPHFTWQLPLNSGPCPWSLPQLPCRSACAHTPLLILILDVGARGVPYCPWKQSIRSRSWCPGPPCCSAFTLLAEHQHGQFKQPHWSPSQVGDVLVLQGTFSGWN